MEEQVLELRPATPIHTSDLAVNHSFALDVEIGNDCFLRFENDMNRQIPACRA
jgi:hypothetical protein